MKPATNLDPDEALALVVSDVSPVETEQIALDDALHRVSAEPLFARLEDPRFDKSAVDGIAVGSEDPSHEFEIVDTIAAGEDKAPSLRPGEAVRIMTGARVPPGAGRVIRFENCVFSARHTDGDATEGGRAHVVAHDAGANIAYRGENISKGDLLFSPRRLHPQDIGILAAQGFSTIPVRRRPRVAVIATGDEIYPAGTELPSTGIYDSNSHQLSAYARAADADVINLGILEDEPERILKQLREKLGLVDVMILSGGVSMGDLDFVPDTLEKLGARILFHGLAVKPGRPTLFALYDGGERTTRVFGLPGNPVSTAVQFELLVNPLLHALSGIEYTAAEARLPLAEPFRRGNADRWEYVPGIMRSGMVVPLRYKGSGHLSALAEATLIYRIDRGIQSMEEGEEVYVRYLR